MFQGDPFSVTIFNTVVNLLLDHIIHACPNTDYRFSSPNRQLSTLQYVNDSCFSASSDKKCQEILTDTEIWLEWAKLEPKVPKCCSLALQSRMSACDSFLNSKLTLGAEKFLSSVMKQSPFSVCQSPSLCLPCTSHRDFIAKRLTNLLEQVYISPVTIKQKLNLYKKRICPRLAWGFRVLELPDSWIKRELEAKTTKFLEKWLVVPKGGNSKLLYLPKKDGGLGLPAMSTFYKQQQASRHILFSTSKDDCISVSLK